MSLQALLQQQRRRTHQRRTAQRIERNAPLTRRDRMEQVAAAWCGRDFLNDLDKLLITRNATLWVVWKGKRGQVYIDSPAGLEVLMETNKQRRSITVQQPGEMGQRISALMKLHNITLAAAWRGGEYVLQAGNADVSNTHCLALVRCTEGHKCRYMIESKEQA